MSPEDEVKSCLPENYTYYFARVSHDSPLEYSASFRIHGLKSEDDFDSWFTLYKAKSKSGWITARANFETKSKLAKFSYAKDYTCLLSSVNKTATSVRNLQCPTSLKVRIKKDTKDVRYKDALCKDGFYCTVEISIKHTHPLENAEALLFLRVTAETEGIFSQYFLQGILFTA